MQNAASSNEGSLFEEQGAKQEEGGQLTSEEQEHTTSILTRVQGLARPSANPAAVLSTPSMPLAPLFAAVGTPRDRGEVAAWL